MITEALLIAVQEAYEYGCAAARVAASWIVDGTTKTEFIPAVLKMMEDGDPAVDDYLPRRPNLSGEWADDPTPQSLASELLGDMDLGPDVIDEIADAFERGVDDTFIDACEAELRKAID